MYLRNILPAILGEEISGDLPKGLSEYYERHWESMENKDRKQFRGFQQPVICMLAQAKEAVSATQIADWINGSGNFESVDMLEVEDVIYEWRQFINEERGDPTRFRLYHKSFLDFLEKKVQLGSYRSAVASAMRNKLKW